MGIELENWPRFLFFHPAWWQFRRQRGMRTEVERRQFLVAPLNVGRSCENHDYNSNTEACAKGDADLISDDKKGVSLDKDDDGEAVRIAAVLSQAAFM